MTKSTAIKTKDTSNEISTEIDLGNSGSGFEDADQDSYAIPFLRPLQKMSPQVDEADGAYIEGAKPGMFFNTVTQELYDGKNGIYILPCAFQRKFLQWAPRDGDGGLKGTYTVDEVARMEQEGGIASDPDTGRLYVPADGVSGYNDKKCDKITDTRNHFCILYDPENEILEQVLISLSSTQIKKSKALMSMLSNAKVKQNGKLQTPPTWMNIIKMTSVPESNDQGSWHGVKFGRGDVKFITDASIFEVGKEFHESVRAGETEVDFSKVNDEPKKDEGF